MYANEKVMINKNNLSRCKLGESPLWMAAYNSYFWLDILNKAVYTNYPNDESGGINLILKAEFIPSAIIHHSTCETKFWLIGNDGIYLFDPSTKNLNKALEIDLDARYRTNDAGVDIHGNLWVGVMEKSPQGLNGHVLVIDTNGNIRLGIDKIGIPNTFAWSTKLGGMIISDSFQKKAFLVRETTNKSSISDHKVILDLSQTEGTPDGGAFDSQGILWLSVWGLGQIISVDDGKIRTVLNVDAPNVTSVCFGGEKLDEMFYTSAIEGLSPDALRSFPYSGYSGVIGSKKLVGMEPLGFTFKEDMQC
jgi:sugar lactone lactonase YvrE